MLNSNKSINGGYVARGTEIDSFTTGFQPIWKVCGLMQIHNSNQERYTNMLRENHALCMYRQLAAARKQQYLTVCLKWSLVTSC